MGRLLNLTVLSFLFLIPFFCLGQSLGNSQVLDDSDREKLYLHFDKKDYVLGDTLWYKSYLVDAATNTPSQQSGIIYVEFIDSENVLVKRFAHHTILGTSIGFIPTDTTYLSSGVYKVRAYSNWMRNFGDSLFFEQEFRLADHQFVDKWFLRIQQPQVLGDSMAMGLHFTDDRGRPLRSKAADFYLLGEKNRVAIHDRLQLDNEGSINVNFNISEKFREGPLFLKITDVGNKKSVRVNAPFDISGRKRDVQFLPESGHLLVGKENKVGFKALGSNGLGSDVEGVVKDDTGKEVAAFRSVYKGMGSFVFTPEPGKVYTAHLSDGKEIALPIVETSGTILQLISERQNPFNVLDGNGSVTEQDNFVDSLINQDSVHLRFMVTADLIGKKYLLMGRSRGQNLYQKEIEMINQVVEIKIGKNVFPSGVSSLILSDKNGLVLNE